MLTVLIQTFSAMIYNIVCEWGGGGDISFNGAILSYHIVSNSMYSNSTLYI